MKQYKYTGKSVAVFFAVTIAASAIVEAAIAITGKVWL